MDETHTYRQDRLTGAWSIIAPGRVAIKQGQDPLAGLPALPGACPFCPGHEAETEAALFVAPEQGAWRVRVVRNRYPMVLPPSGDENDFFHPHPSGSAQAGGSPRVEAGGSPRVEAGGSPRVEAGHSPAGALGGAALPATGLQELVIESPDHDADFTRYDTAHAVELLGVLRTRLAALEATPGIVEVNLFRNKGRRAGASQPHPHSQLVATTLASPEGSLRWARAEAHHQAHGTPLIDAVLAQELAAGARVLRSGPDLVTLMPFAPRHRYETWIVPREARGSFSALPDALLRPLAAELVDTLARVLEASGRTDYNLLFRIPPVAHRAHPAAFWYIEIAPRGSGAAGVELLSGFSIVGISPELAAERVRSTRPARAGSADGGPP